MAYAMTKRGSQDNVITDEFMCDTISDMNAIENRYRTIGTIAIVLEGESGGLEVYITGSNKQWVALNTGASSDSAAGGGSLSIYICSQNEISNGLPDIDEPNETTIYLVPAGNTTGNLYEEYIYVDDAWEKFGAASIDLSNYVQKTDYATQNTAGVVKVLDNGNVTFNENHHLVLTLAGTNVIKSGVSEYTVPVTRQHEAVFYGLAKAAGQDMKNSANAIGTYTTEAATAIRTMIGAGTYSKPISGIPAEDLASGVIPDTSIYVTKENAEFTGNLSMNRRGTAGINSVALGYQVKATGMYSFSGGEYCESIAHKTFTFGDRVIANSRNQFVIGVQNNNSSLYSNWQANTSYNVNDCVKKGIDYYICKEANNDSSFDSLKWTQILNFETDNLFIVGNGFDSYHKSNALTLNWQGDLHIKDDLYINANADGTGGTPVGSTIAALQAEINSLRAALEALTTPASTVLMENGTPLTDESGNTLEFDLPST